MREMSIWEAAMLLDCSLEFINDLLVDEILATLCEDELEIYREKAPVIHDNYLHQELFDFFHCD